MGGEESEANLSPRPPVNNSAPVEAARLNWNRIWEEYLGADVVRNATRRRAPRCKRETSTFALKEPGALGMR